MKKKIDKIIFGCAGFFFMFLFVFSGEGLAKDEILMGYSASITGGYSHVGKMIKDGYTVWGEMINRKGGIFVKDLNKN